MRHPQDLEISLGVVPYAAMGKLKTIDRREIESCRNIASVIRDFMASGDRSPLNIGVFGPAGSGKTFIVKCIAEHLHDRVGLAEREVRPMTFNLSQFGRIDLLTEAFEEIQDVGLRGDVPLVFWDEYDSDLDGAPLGWLRYFLGPMDDGQYFQRERTRRIPRAIFVFAGSMFTSYRAMEVLNEHARRGHNMRVDNFTIEQWRAAKGPDFKSRLGGVLDVLGVNKPPRIEVRDLGGANSSQDRKIIRSLPTDEFGHLIRRAIILRDELLRRFPQLFEDDELQISPKVADAFLHVKRFVHGARSIRQIVKMSSVGSLHKVYDTSCLPAASQLRIHVDPSEFETWYAALDSHRELHDGGSQ